MTIRSARRRAGGRSAFAAGFAVALLALSAVAAPRAEAGWVAVEKNGSTTLFSGGLMKMTYPGGNAVMLSAATSELTVIDSANHAYAVGSTDEYCSTASKLMDEMLASVPADQRPMMEKMLGRDQSGKTHKVVVTESGAEKILGFETTKYTVSVDGAPYQDVWVTSDAKLRHDTAALGKISGQLTACLKSMGKGSAPEGSVAYAALMEKGLPLRILSYGPSGQSEPLLEVTSLSARDIAADEFKVPAGYEKKPLAEMIRAQMGPPSGGAHAHAGGSGSPQ